MYPKISRSFSEDLSNLAEFRLLRNNNNLFDHQEFVKRYISPYTPYKFLVLYHSLGSGKTIASLSVSINHYNLLRIKTIVVTRGDSAEQNFRDQINRYETLNDVVIDRSIFTYYHYIQLANIINKDRDADIFSGNIVIMDEIHNLKNMEERGTLDTISVEIKNARNSKFIFSTATPMIDSSEEIYSLLNLAQKNDLGNLGDALLGLVSYSKKSTEKPRENVISNRVVGGRGYYVSTMIDAQKLYYVKQRKKKQNHIFMDLVYISLFVFSNGMYGALILEECMEEVEVGIVVHSRESGHRKEKIIHCLEVTLKEELRKYVTVDALGSHSCIYKSLIDILTSTTGKVFIFLEYVTGSGILLLAAILKEYGYEMYSGEDINSMYESDRCTICVGDASFSPNIEDRISTFNDERNINGEYVRIMIGSKVMGESISLFEVKQFHFICPHWNYSVLDQAKGRVIREGSHNRLPLEERYVDIYVHLSVLDDGESIDERKISTSSKKQEDILEIEKVMIDSSIDRYCYELPTTLVGMYMENFFEHYLEEYIDDQCILHIYSETQDVLSSDFIETYSFRNSPFKYKELFETIKPKILPEIVKIIITQNLPAKVNTSKKYMRASPSRFYWTEEFETPFFDFPQLIYPRVETSFVKSVIHVLERAFLECNIDLLERLPMLYMPSGEKFYHILYYRELEKSYSVSSLVPSSLSGRMRVFQDASWSFVSRNKEAELMKEFKDSYERFMSSNNMYPIFGYISITDQKMRIRKSSLQYSDKRRISRGIVLSSLKVEELYNIATSLGLRGKSSKKESLESITKHIIDEGFFHYI